MLNIIPILPVVDAPGYTPAIFPEQEYLQDARRYAEHMLLASAEALRAEGITTDYGVEIGNNVVGNIIMGVPSAPPAHTQDEQLELPWK